MQYTLLQLTQDILSSMDSDEINSITDTSESEQVVTVIKTVYDDIISRGDFSKQKTLFNLDASGTTAKPVLMTKPSTMHDIDWIKYNKIEEDGDDPVWVEIKYLPIEDFILRSHFLLPSDDNVAAMSHTTDGFTFSFNYYTDVGPTYYTSFNDNTLIFDAFDSDVDSTLQVSKTLCFGEKAATFSETDSWVPNLHPHQFALLLNEAKSLAWAELKQTSHAKAENSARKNWIRLQKTKRTVPDGEYDTGPNYGRK